MTYGVAGDVQGTHVQRTGNLTNIDRFQPKEKIKLAIAIIAMIGTVLCILAFDISATIFLLKGRVFINLSSLKKVTSFIGILSLSILTAITIIIIEFKIFLKCLCLTPNTDNSNAVAPNHLPHNKSLSQRQQESLSPRQQEMLKLCNRLRAIKKTKVSKIRKQVRKQSDENLIRVASSDYNCSDYNCSDFNGNGWFETSCEIQRKIGRNTTPKSFEKLMELHSDHKAEHGGICGDTDLHCAIYHGNLLLARYLVQTNPELVNTYNLYGVTPLFFAALSSVFDEEISKEKSTQIAQMLLTNKADPNIAVSHGFEHYIFQDNNRTKESINLNIPSHATPLWFAAESGNLSLTTVLLKHGAEEYAKIEEETDAETDAGESYYPFRVYHSQYGYDVIDEAKEGLRCIEAEIIKAEEERLQFMFKQEKGYKVFISGVSDQSFFTLSSFS